MIDNDLILFWKPWKNGRFSTYQLVCRIFFPPTVWMWVKERSRRYFWVLWFVAAFQVVMFVLHDCFVPLHCQGPRERLYRSIKLSQWEVIWSDFPRFLKTHILRVWISTFPCWSLWTEAFESSPTPGSSPGGCRNRNRPKSCWNPGKVQRAKWCKIGCWQQKLRWFFLGFFERKFAQMRDARSIDLQ